MRKQKFFRLVREKTLDQLSLGTGIDIPRLSRAERGLVKLTAEEKAQIAKELDATIEAVFPED